MKTYFKSIALLIAMAFASTHVVAKDPPKPSDPKKIELPPRVKPHPRTPDAENIVRGLLDGHVLTITFAEPEGMARVSLREGGITTVYTGFHATVAPIVVTVPATDVPVQIYIKTQSNEYEGWIE